MKHRACFFTVTTTVVVAFFIGIGRSQSPPVPQTAYVEGRITSAVTGEPLRANVAVSGTFLGGGGSNVPTGSDGNYIVSVKPGTYRIAVSCGECSMQRYGQKSPTGSGKPVRLAAGERLKIDFAMLPSCVISGRVLDEEGDPISRVQVKPYVYRFGGSGDKGELISNWSTTTNDRGEYRLFELQPGEYFIGSLERSSNATTFFPGTADPDAAQAIRLEPGAEVRNVDFRLAPAKTMAVRGRVLTPSGAPAAQENVIIRRVSRLIVSSDPVGTLTRNDGSFQFLSVSQGSYNLYAGGARVTIEVTDSDLNGVLITLRDGLDIPGRIRLESEPAQPFPMSLLFINLERSDDFGYARAKIAADGTFTLKNVIPGSYRFKMSRAIPGDPRPFLAGLPQGHIESATLGSANAIGLFNVGAGGDSLQIIIGFQGGRVTGTVLDSTKKPYSAGFVALIPDDPRRGRVDLTFTGSSDELGRFTLENVPSGSYHLFAFEEQPPIGPGALFDPAFMHSFEALSHPVRVERNTTTEAVLTVIPNE